VSFTNSITRNPGNRPAKSHRRSRATMSRSRASRPRAADLGHRAVGPSGRGGRRTEHRCAVTSLNGASACKLMSLCRRTRPVETAASINSGPVRGHVLRPLTNRRSLCVLEWLGYSVIFTIEYDLYTVYSSLYSR
jgi:hypothetical protein